jgi:hypothetical protein
MDAISTDPDVNRLFDKVIRSMVYEFAYSYEGASSLARKYYELFRDEAYCKTINVPVQDDDFFFHEAANGMALRIHYYLGLKLDPDPRSFVKWRAEYQKSRSRRQSEGAT